MLRDVRVRIAGACMLSAAVGFAVGNGHTTSGAVEHVSDQLGQEKVRTRALASVAGCQEKRADIAEGDIAAPNGLLHCAPADTAVKKPMVVLSAKK